MARISKRTTTGDKLKNMNLGKHTGKVLWSALGLTAAFNVVMWIGDGYKYDDTVERSQTAYVAEQQSKFPSEITISVNEITNTFDSHKDIRLTDGEYERVKALIKGRMDIASNWSEKVDDLLDDVPYEGRKLWLPMDLRLPLDFTSRGTELLETADRYLLTVMPGETATSWPALEIKQDETNGRYTATFRVANNWEQEQNRQALIAFLDYIQQNETMREDISGKYKIERDQTTGTMKVVDTAKPVVAPQAPGLTN